jgi:hypothetical protein
MFLSKTIGVIFIIALAGLCVPGQTPQPTASPESSGPPGVGTISGQVVDENEQPVPNATVFISAIRSTSRNSSQTVITNRNGEFLIKGLQPLDYAFSVTAPSYLAGRNEPLRENGVYLVGDRVRLRMIKGGVVSGRVTDENDRPVVGVGVRAQMVRDTAGRVLPRGQYFDKWTDDRGVYRIYGLRPGTYVVFAGGPDTQRRTYEQTSFELDVPSYAPSSTRETAAEYGVRSGEEVSNVDIRYRGEQGRTISGEVTVPSNMHSGFSVMLTSGADAGLLLSTTFSRGANRSFVFRGVGDGEYKLMAHSNDSSGEIAISDSKPISVRGGDVTGVKLTAKVLGSVSGRVVLEETKIAECTDKQNPLANETLVIASPNETESTKPVPQTLHNLWSLGAPVRPDREGNFLLQNLAPGEYYFGLRFYAPQWYLNSITFAPGTSAANPNQRTTRAAPVDASRRWTNVKQNERLPNLTITLVHGAASLRGMFLLADGERVPPRLFIYLVPAELQKANDVLRYFAEQVQSNGYIGLANIAPGRYWVLAQTVDGTDSPQMTIRLPNESETRTRLRRDAEAAKNEIELKPCQSVDRFQLPQKPSAQ